MKKILLALGGFILGAVVFIGTPVGAQVSTNYWKLSNNVLTPILSSWTLGSASTNATFGTLTVSSCTGCGGGSGSGTVATSSHEVANQIAYFTTTSGTPAKISGNANLTYDSSSGGALFLSATNASGGNTAGGGASLYAGNGAGTESGGSVYLLAGNGGATNANGGSIFLYVGAKTGAGTTGTVNLYNSTSGVFGILDVSNIVSSNKNYVFPNADGTFCLTNATCAVPTGTNGRVLALVGGTPTFVATTTFSAGLLYASGNVTFNAAGLTAAGYTWGNSTLSGQQWCWGLSGPDDPCLNFADGPLISTVGRFESDGFTLGNNETILMGAFTLSYSSSAKAFKFSNQVNIASTTPYLLLNDTSVSQDSFGLYADNSIFKLDNFTDSQNIFTVGTTYNTGFGTTTPWAKLSVLSATSPIFALATSTAANSQKPVFEVDATGHVIYSGKKPSCNANCTFIAGNDSRFRVRLGTTVTSATITFATSWGNPSPICLANEGSAGTVTVNASSTPTTVVLTALSLLSSVNVDVHCDGIQ